MVPWIFVVQTVMVTRVLGWRRALKRWLVTVAGVALLAVVGIYELAYPDATWPLMERTICTYGLCALVIVTSWLWAITGQPIHDRLVRPAHVATGRRIVSRVVAILLFVVVLYPYLFSFLQTHWPKRIGAVSPHRLRLDTDDITWHSYDGTRLAGWFVRAGDSNRSAVVCHGVAADKSDMIGFIVALNHAGYNVLAFDFRGHGQSAGHTISFGNYEQDDIRSAIDMLYDRYPERCKRLVGVGWSMGAASLILAAAEDHRIEALHVDAVYARTFDIAQGLASHARHWRRWNRARTCLRSHR